MRVTRETSPRHVTGDQRGPYPMTSVPAPVGIDPLVIFGSRSTSDPAVYPPPGIGVGVITPTSEEWAHIVPEGAWASALVVPELGMYLLGGRRTSGLNSHGAVITTVDAGETWVEATLPFATYTGPIVVGNAVTALGWSSDLERLVAMRGAVATGLGPGDVVEGTRVAWSDDGVTWTLATDLPFGPLMIEPTDVIWVPSLELFFATANTLFASGAPNFATSPDGIDWSGVFVNPESF